jgi:arylformamidase
MPRKLIDVSHEIEAGMITYPGLPGPLVSDYLSREASRGKYSQDTTFQIGRIEMITNTGTYIDAPFHRYQEGFDIARIPLERIADLEAIVIDATRLADRVIGPERFEGVELCGRAVLIRTNWDAHWRTPRYGENAPFVSREAAEFLVKAAPALVGVDSVNIDDMQDGTRPAHTLLLGAGIPIVEHLAPLSSRPIARAWFSLSLCASQISRRRHFSCEGLRGDPVTICQ